MLPQSRQAKRRKLAIARGEWQPWGDVAAVAKHVRGLQARGGTLASISQATGVSVATLLMVTRGKQERIRSDTAEQILAVEAAKPGRRSISANGPTLMLRSLQAMGHCSPDIAVVMSQHAGRPIHHETVRRLIAGEAHKVKPEVLSAVKSAYGELWDKRPAEDTPVQRRNATVARQRAERNGWPTPMFLDDEKLADPNYRVPYQRQRWMPAEGTGIAEMEREAG